MADLQEAKRIFQEALEKEPHLRSHFVRASCKGDEPLLSRVTALLKAHHQATDSFLEPPIVTGGTDLEEALTILERPGAAADELERVGAYKLLERIGEGGFGTVYLADQREPIRRLVALKRIKPGLATNEILARFESERQALALMNHPNVAQVFDAGRDERGRPFFVMEYVAGIPITKYCDEHRLKTAARLGLFLQVCDAIQHAHQKGIIHRDLKPSNVLVTDIDGAPLAKVIDFGVAKAAGPRLADRTLQTAAGAVLGTPPYMSPEQADASPADVDTRSDVYALGVLLYELLVGFLPHDPGRLRSAGYSEMVRILHEEEPIRPSARLAGHGDAVRVSRDRRTDYRALRRQLADELDWVVMKALEKDRSRRYTTASGLAADVRRYLEGEPIMARPPSLRYRAGKFVRRHKLVVAASTAFVVGVVIFGAVAAMLGIEARRQAHRVRAHSLLVAAAAAEDPLLKVLLLSETAEFADLPGRLQLAHEAANMVLPLQSFDGHRGAVRSADFSPDGRLLATGSSDNSVILHDLIAGRSRRLEGLHDDWVRSVAFSADGSRLVVASDDGTVSLVDPDGAREPRKLRGHDGFVRAAAFSPGGDRVVTASDDERALVWLLADGRSVALAGHTDTVMSAAFDPSGERVVTASLDETALVWPAGGASEPLLELRHSVDVLSAAYAPGGESIVTGSADGVVRTWDAQEGTLLAELRGHEGPVHSVRFSPDGRRILSASGDFTARLWSPDGEVPPVVLRGHAGPVFGAAFDARGNRVVTASDDGTARVWPVEWDSGARVFRGHREAVMDVLFSPDGRRIATASADGTARVWSLDGTHQTVILPGHEGPLRDLEFSPDGSFVLTAADDATARVSPASGIGEVTIFQGHAGPLNRATFSADGALVATASSDGTARIWRLGSSGRARVLRGHGGPITDLEFGPGGERLLTSSRDRTVRLWDLDSDSPPRVFDSGFGVPLSVEFDSRGERFVAAFTGDTALVWDLPGEGPPLALERHQDWVRRASFSPDGARVVTASDDGWAIVWHLDESRRPVILNGHQDYVMSAEFGPNGDYVVTASVDGTARVWRADGLGAPAVLSGHEGEVTAARFSPDGTYVVTASVDGTARIWPVNWRTIVARLRARTQACLSAQQRTLFLAEGAAEARRRYEQCQSERGGQSWGRARE